MENPKGVARRLAAVAAAVLLSARPEPILAYPGKMPNCHRLRTRENYFLYLYKTLKRGYVVDTCRICGRHPHWLYGRYLEDSPSWKYATFVPVKGKSYFFDYLNTGYRDGFAIAPWDGRHAIVQAILMDAIGEELYYDGYHTFDLFHDQSVFK